MTRAREFRAHDHDADGFCFRCGAPTPSDAARLCGPDCPDLLRELAEREERIENWCKHYEPLLETPEIEMSPLQAEEYLVAQDKRIWGLQ